MPALMRTCKAVIVGVSDEPVEGVVSKAASTPKTNTNDVTDLQRGQFKAVVSVFGNTDSYGDVIEKGAFKASLAAWKKSGDPIPLIWSHRFDDPDNILGELVAEETDEGLVVTATFDLESPRAAQVYRLMQRRLIREFSFSGEILEYSLIKPEDEEESDYWGYTGLSIKKLDLWEAGPCLKGANPETRLIGIKSSDFSGDIGERLKAQEAQTQKTTSNVEEILPEDDSESVSDDSVEPNDQRSAAGNPSDQAIAMLSLMAIH